MTSQPMPVAMPAAMPVAGKKPPMNLGIAIMLAGLLVTLGCAVAPQPQDKSIALIFMPGTGYPEITARLDRMNARAMRIGSSQNIVIARFYDGWSLLGLWQAGALVPLKARGVGDCLNTSQKFAALAPNTSTATLD